MTIVDPMHNLFLGTAKRMIKIWIQQDILTRSAMTTMCSNGRNRAAATYLVEVDGIAVRDYYSVTHHTNCASSGP